MRSVGVRELKEQTSELVRLVREQGEVIEVTYRGAIVAKLVPAKAVTSAKSVGSIWTDLDALADEISQYWPSSVSAAEVIQQERREL